jgi:leucyl aminopeptidase (aminopeptidase T)
MRAGKFVIESIFCVKPGERVLIVTDTDKAEFAEPFMAAAFAAGAEAMTLTMTPRTYPGESLPEPINAAIRASDVVIGCVSRSMAAPIWTNIRSDPAVTTRGASISAISDGVMMGGGLWADPHEVMRITNGVYEVVSKAQEWRLTTGAGTDLTARIGSCRIVERQPISEPRMGGVLPGCEVALDPAPGTMEGVFYSDGSCGVLSADRLGYTGVINEPIKCTVERGMIVGIEGQKEARLFKSIMESMRHPCAYEVTHMAIGCNPNCRMSGDYISDEKILAGVHVANAGTEGCPSGAVDHCLQHPSLWLDGKQVIDDWRFIGPMAHLQPA